jgi:hypothetical protein
MEKSVYLCCQWESQSHSPAHVLMRLYQINKAKEGGHDRMQNNYLVINSTIVDYMICSFIILSSFIDTFYLYTNEMFTIISV